MYFNNGLGQSSLISTGAGASASLIAAGAGYGSSAGPIGTVVGTITGLIASLFGGTGVREAHEKQVAEGKAKLLARLRSNPKLAIKFLEQMAGDGGWLGCPGKSVEARICWSAGCELAKGLGWKPKKGEIKPYQGRPWESLECKDSYEVQVGQASASIRRWLAVNLPRIKAGQQPLPGSFTREDIARIKTEQASILGTSNFLPWLLVSGGILLFLRR